MKDKLINSTEVAQILGYESRSVVCEHKIALVVRGLKEIPGTKPKYKRSSVYDVINYCVEKGISLW